MYDEESYIMLSALQHSLFCPSQCALIHPERIWEDNTLTVKVHNEENESRKDIIISRSLRLASAKLGIIRYG